ncbi:MAG: 6-bladed beta-propeller [Spirochaetaceae bacterium]|jgi:DNA-binding beta-propeller fold protein YncE|nr:6-bladed beta-propeller [Spirochaetaceae bacterium]
MRFSLVFMRRPFPVLIALCLAIFAVSLYSQIVPEPDLNGVRAGEEFRIGIQAYNRYAYNEAIRAFESALAYRPNEALILDWLGRAYYKSGLEEIALRQWERAAEMYGNERDEALLARARIEAVAARRSPLVSMAETSRFVEGGTFPGVQDGATVFRQPTAVLPRADGSAWVVAYTSNEVVRVDPNGVIRERLRGPLGGFDRPYDVAHGLDGRLYVSEFRGGRLSILDEAGQWQAHVGGKGLTPGSLIGPSSLTIDDAGYVYVVEYGNRRISKFSPDGEFIHNFGQKDGIFPGFLSPTGIAYLRGRIFAVDGAKKAIYTFDTDGIYQGVFLDEGLDAPESLRVWDDHTFLLADTRRLLLIDADSAIIQEAGLAGNRSTRIVDANFDQNGSILAANFDANEVAVMQSIDELASGLFVQIDRIVTENFPEVTLDVSVSDRKGRPIVGLGDRNFLLSEGQGETLAQVAGQTLLGSLDRDPRTDIVIVVERSGATAALREDLAAAVRDIYNAVQGTDITIAGIVSAGENPERERFDGANPSTLTGAARGAQANYSPRWRFDSAIRLAAADLLPLAKKRAVVFVTSGSLGALSFEQYSITETAAYLQNANIGFYPVLVGQAPPSDDLAYLAKTTDGRITRLYAPEGIGAAVKSITARASGSYLLRYRSSLPSDFGRAFLPIEAEVYLLERSGRDRAGYFAPLS